jgi:hypothetical protein
MAYETHGKVLHCNPDSCIVSPMMITTDTVCGRVIRERPKNVWHFWWGDGVPCCGHCISIAESRESWREYAS